MLDLEADQNGLTIDIAADGRVWINDASKCLLRIGPMEDPSRITLYDARKFSVRHGIPGSAGQKSENAITHTSGSLGLCSCGHPMLIHEDGVCIVCAENFDDTVPGGSQGAMRQPCGENK